MTRPLRVAALQLRAHERADFAHTLAPTLEQIALAAKDTDLLVLPESTFPAYVLGTEPVDARAIESAVQALREIAAGARTAIVAGVALAQERGTRNAALVIDRDGSVAGRADKLFLWHFDRRWFEAGDRIAPVRTSIGTLGAFVCADGRIPTIASTLVDRGAEILVMPTAWVTSGRNPGALENAQADLLARVRARENGVPFVAANKCGAELGMVAYCGKSQIVDARGDVVALAPERESARVSAVVEIAPAAPRQRRADPPPQTRPAFAGVPVRIAVSYEAPPADLDARLEILDDAFAVAPGARERFEALDRVIPSFWAGDAEVLDPVGLVPYKRAGYQLVVWSTGGEPAWVERFARARALELRVYVVVFGDADRRAYAVDPDGIVQCGTFADFTLASFALDPRKTLETFVAPGTDVREGIERVAALVQREAAAAQ